MSAVPCIPPELQDQIIDHLHDNKPALATCALVCREWRTTSQFQLFRNVHVRHPRMLPQFRTFLAAAPHIGGVIRELILCGEAQGQKGVAQMVVAENEIVTCVEELPSLRALTLDAVWLAPSYHNPAAPKPTPSHLRTLRITRTFAAPATLFDAVMSFPGLQALHVEDIRSTFIMSSRTPAKSTTPPALRSLSLASSTAAELLPYFIPGARQRLTLKGITTLSLDFDNIRPCYELCDLLQEVGAELELLGLSRALKRLVGAEAYVESLGMASLARLRSLSLSFHSAGSLSLASAILDALPGRLNDLRITYPEGAQRNVLNDLKGMANAMAAVFTVAPAVDASSRESSRDDPCSP